jgi:glutamyl-tRNA synthetase
MSHQKTVVTRFAPSPTGWLHVGGIRTALYAWLWARKNKGTFILRIEDTDKEREVEGSMEHIIESLTWLGIYFDQGPGVEGPHSPYIQSKRLSLYKKYANMLIEKGYAYPDPFSHEEVESFRKSADDKKMPYLFREHRPSDTSLPWDGTKPLRFKTPVKEYSWHDVVRGDLSAGTEAVDDFILIKRDGYPTYNFAHIIDDLEMGVTHIMRADEFISSTPKFLAVYEALGIERPLFVTLPPILAEGGNKKLGKRDGAKDILEYRDEGYLPSAIVNFLALLGWNPGHNQEIYTMEELIENFDVERVQKSGAQLDHQKLVWINREHIKLLTYEEQEEYITKFLPEETKQLPECTTERIHMLVPTIIERIEKFGDVRDLALKGELSFFFEQPKLEKNMICYKDSDCSESASHLDKIFSILKAIPEAEWSLSNLKEKIMSYVDTLPKRGPALHPLRYSLSGKEHSPDPFTIASIIEKEETLIRVEAGISALK